MLKQTDNALDWLDLAHLVVLHPILLYTGVAFWKMVMHNCLS